MIEKLKSLKDKVMEEAHKDLKERKRESKDNRGERSKRVKAGRKLKVFKGK